MTSVDPEQRQLVAIFPLGCHLGVPHDGTVECGELRLVLSNTVEVLFHRPSCSCATAAAWMRSKVSRVMTIVSSPASSANARASALESTA